MNKKHEKKYTMNLVIGLILTTIGISTVIYVALEDQPRFDWVFWAIVASMVINGGLFFLGSAMIHKVKADLIRKQRQKAKTETSLAQSE